MRRCLPLSLLSTILKHMLSIKFFFFVSCTSFVLSVIWIQFNSDIEEQPISETLVQEALENVARDYRYTDVYRKTSRLPKDFKYILLWTRHDFAPFSFLGNGQRAFLQNNCSVINCYVTTDRNFFNGDVTKFDAIAFNGRNMKHKDLPKKRSSKQKFIYFNMESADNYPVCQKEFEGFFNWTATYKLNSDIPLPYIQIRDSNYNVVGPKEDMHWIEDLPQVDDEFKLRLANKTKAAAWFVSHCKSRSGRKEFVVKLQKALKPYSYSVDVYGSCGKLKCPRNKKKDCDKLLEKDYYFYMSLENSFSEDYVTEKLLTALQHDLVPIVYGGANYTRFLPPGSYIDGRKYDTKELAALIHQLIKNPELYAEYFKWKTRYTYNDPSEVENVCAVCEALNNRDMVETQTTYHEFRRWWYPGYMKRCGGTCAHLTKKQRLLLPVTVYLLC